MTPTMVNKLVAALHVASGRDWSEVTEAVYQEALKNVPDDVGEEAMKHLIRHVSWEKPPSPAMVLTQANGIIARRRDATPAIPESTARESTREEAIAHVRAMREQHAEALARRPPTRARRPRMNNQEGEER